MEAATGQEVELCLECIEWAKAEKRTFLRQALEVRLGGVAGLVHTNSFAQPLELIHSQVAADNCTKTPNIVAR